MDQEHSQDDHVDPDSMGEDDRRVAAWAVSTATATGRAVSERVRRSGKGLTVGELAAMRQEWEGAGRPAPQLHVHRTAVVFANGTSLLAVSFVAENPYSRQTLPAFGLYLDARWDPPWPHEHVDWPDFGQPVDSDSLRTSLRELLDRARGELVEIGCLGGHGRTGTALACLAVLTGTPAADAVDWVRTNYCPNAVETDQQRSFVEQFSP